MSAYSLKQYLNLRTLGLLALYAVVCGFSYFLAFQLRFDFNVPEHFTTNMVRTIGWVVGLKLIMLLVFGQVDSVLAYFRLPDLMQLFFSLSLSSVFLVVLWYNYEGLGMPPRGVILADLLISFLLLPSFRVGLRVRASSHLKDWLRWDAVENIIHGGSFLLTLIFFFSLKLTLQKGQVVME